MSLKQKLFENTIWSVGGQLGYSTVQLASNIVFARFLSPDEFGQLGIIMFFVIISNVLIEGGLGGALVRKIDATEIDYSTVFIFNLLVSLMLYALLFFGSSHIADYYNDASLRKLITVAGIIIIINSLNLVQNTRLVKNLKFKRIATYNLTSIVLANIIGVIMLLKGFGIWSLVAVIILNPTILGIILWIREGGFKIFRLSRNSFEGLYKFGINTTLATIIDTAFNNVYQLVLAKWFSISQAGFFYQAKKLQDVPNAIISGTTNTVIFSGLSSLQNEHKKFTQAYSKVVLYFSVLMGMITLIIISYSKEIIVLLYGDKWAQSSFYLIILASASFFYVHEMFNRVIFKTFDRTKFILGLEIVKKLILLLSIIIGVLKMNIKVLLIGFFIVSCLSYFINNFFSRKVAKVTSWDELISLIKVIIAVSVSSTLIYVIKHNFELESIKILLTIPLIAILYLILIRILGLKISIREFKELNFLRTSSPGK